VALISHPIPVQVSGPVGTTPPGGQIAQIFWVIPGGRIVKGWGDFPVVGGFATYVGPQLEPGLAWAIMVRDPGAQGPLFRSGALARLPGPGPFGPWLSTAIEIFRDPHGANFGLNAGEGAPELVAQRLGQLPPPMTFVSVALNVDSGGRELVTVRGRLRLLLRNLPFVYTLPVRVFGSNDPTRPGRAVAAIPDGPPLMRGANMLPHAAVLNRAILDGVEIALSASAAFIGRAQQDYLGAPNHFDPTSFSVSGISQQLAGTEANVTIKAHAGAVTGGLVPPLGGGIFVAVA
jgi:hypothetical protein